MKYLPILFIAFLSMNCSPKLSPDHSWGNQRWVLVELKRVPVQQSETRRDAYVNFETGNKRFTGYGGCNQISGSYTLDNNNIRFGEASGSKTSCSDIEFENVFLSTLSGVDRYEVKGNDLLLKRNREVMLVLRTK